MKYLRKIEKFNPRYLYSKDYLKEGNHNVFWGFLNDLWCYYHNKVSPYDRRFYAKKPPKGKGINI